MFESKFCWIKWNVSKHLILYRFCSRSMKNTHERQIFRERLDFFVVKLNSAHFLLQVSISRFIWHFKGTLPEAEFGVKYNSLKMWNKCETKCILTYIININHCNFFVVIDKVNTLILQVESTVFMSTCKLSSL